MQARSVDGLAIEAYSLQVMNFPTSIPLTLSVILFSALLSGRAEDLEAALKAQKKKAQRHVYSRAALIENRELVVPKTASEEERALDRDLEKLERQLSQQVANPQRMTAPRTFSRTPKPVDNWLTPTLLDPNHEDALPSETHETGWVQREIERQKSIQQHEKELVEEEALVNKLLQEEIRKEATRGKSTASIYEPSFQSQITPGVTPPSSFPFLGVSQVKSTIGVSKISSQFSPKARADSGIIKPSFSSAPVPISSATRHSSSWRSPLESSTQKSPTDFSSDWRGSTTKSLSPLKRVRQASPIHRKDPFADDFMPEIKTSIWD